MSPPRARLDEGALPAEAVAAPPPPVAGEATPPLGRTVAALAAVQGRALVRHPVFLAGVAMALLGSGIFVVVTRTDPIPSWHEDSWTVLVGAGFLGLFTMVAANYAALRDRREHTQEQHEALPAPRTAATGGLLLATAWPAVVCAVLLAAVAAYGATRVSIADHEVLHLAERVVAVVTMGTLGVALARLLPSPFLAPLAAWGLLYTSPPETPSAWHVLSPIVHIDSLELAAWHLAYLAGMALVFSAAALLRLSRSPRLVAMALAGVAVAAASIAAMLPEACPGAGRCLL